MKTIITLTVILTCISLHTVAQDTNSLKKNEYYITIEGFSPFSLGMHFKRKISNTYFFKMGLIDLSLNRSNTLPTTSTKFPTTNLNMSSGVEFGIEKRIKVTNKFSTFVGFGLSGTFINNSMKVEDPSVDLSKRETTMESWKVALPLSVGFIYNLSPNLGISAEMNPEIGYKTSRYNNPNSTINNYTRNEINYGFDTRVCQISVLIRP
jgi:hypothetical protein